MTEITLYKWTDYRGIPGHNKGFSLSGVMSFDFVGEVEEGKYLLPTGFELAESNAGTLEIYAPNGYACTIEHSDDLPLLRYGGKVITLNKAMEPLVGVAEAADILGWKKQKVATYIARGVFPEPVQRLASSPIWTRKQIEDYRDTKQKDSHE